MHSVTTTLLRKELDQNRRALLWLLLFTVFVVWVSIRFLAESGSLLSWLTLFSFYANPALIITAFLVGHMLVVREYYGGTQRFLEALPASALTVSTAKYLFGLAVTGGLALGAWVWSLWLADPSEALDLTFLMVMASRVVVFVLLLWSFVFVWSHLGRLRVPMLAGLVVFVMVLDRQTTFELSRFGPYALIDEELFSSERTRFPVRAIAESLLLTCLTLVAGAWLVLRHEGSVVERLAVSMTRGEKTFLVVAAIAGVILTGVLEEEPAVTAPTAGGAAAIETPHTTVVYLEPRYRRAAEHMSDYLETRMAHLDELVGLPEKFHLHVDLTPMEQPWEYHTNFSDAELGLAVAANFDSGSAWSDEQFGAYTMHQVLAAYSRERYLLEQHHALVDGYSLWLAREAHSSPAEAEVDPVLVQALVAMSRLPATATTLREWDVASEVLGDSLGLALAYSVWWQVSRLDQPGVVDALAARLYGTQPRGDVRDWWQELHSSQARQFAEATGIEWESFVGLWADEMKALGNSPRYADAVAAFPSGAFRAEPVTGQGGNLNVIVDLDEPAPGVGPCHIMHAAMPGFDAPITVTGLRKQVVMPEDPATLSFQLTGLYGASDRVFVALDCKFRNIPNLIRLGQQRITLP